MASKRIYLILCTVVCCAGCSVYHRKPLTRAAVEGSLEPPPVEELRVEASRIHHPILRPVALNLRDGISPDEAAVLAVLLNPTLRADRDRRGLARAQLLQAGLLPNPQLSYSKDYVTGGNTAGTVSAFGLGASWDVDSLVTLLPKLTAAREDSRSVDLDIAWNEWQTAQAARTSAFRVIALEAQLASAREADQALQENTDTLQKAVEAHERTVLDLAASQSASQDAHATALEIEQELDRERLALKKAIGFPPDAEIRLQRGIDLPSKVDPPSERDLVGAVEDRRLDLLGLKQGYQSQEATVRAAILAQFPKIGLGFNQASDTSNVHTTGFGVTLDLPLFDRGQGTIATERATRQKLFDEYTARVFEARSDIATALSDIRSLNKQIAAAREALPVLEHLVDTAKTAVDEGNADVLGYYQARTNFIQKRIQVLKLEQQLVETRAALEIASGRYLPGPSNP